MSYHLRRTLSYSSQPTHAEFTPILSLGLRSGCLPRASFKKVTKSNRFDAPSTQLNLLNLSLFLLGKRGGASVLECGGSHAALDWVGGRPSCGLSVDDSKAVNPKRRRRCALPAHSKTRRRFRNGKPLICANQDGGVCRVPSTSTALNRRDCQNRCVIRSTPRRWCHLAAHRPRGIVR